ncbi:hypothetical protein [Austwickia chelonae]|uniref:hypothetical protein n=1 Tax=Austwickia chelonae TaxID=100225 RepID=UPI0002DDD2AF|nr:hypothetical protein [Austwickia chelonae]
MKKVTDDVRRYDDGVLSRSRRGLRCVFSCVRTLLDVINFFLDIITGIFKIASWFSRR